MFILQLRCIDSGLWSIVSSIFHFYPWSCRRYRPYVVLWAHTYQSIADINTFSPRLFFFSFHEKWIENHLALSTVLTIPPPNKTTPNDKNGIYFRFRTVTMCVRAYLHCVQQSLFTTNQQDNENIISIKRQHRPEQKPKIMHTKTHKSQCVRNYTFHLIALHAKEKEDQT